MVAKRKTNRIGGLIFGVVALATLSSCNRPAAPLTDGEQMILSILKLQVADGRAICVDNRTNQPALLVFHAMMKAPAPSRVMLGWSAPRPLRPVNDLTNRRLYEDQILGQRVQLNEPTGTPRLAADAQRKLNGMAYGLSTSIVNDTVTIRGDWGGPTVAARWWLFNRAAPSCSPIYRFSDPVWNGNVGFVSVRADHWGTIYALQKGKTGWTPVAQWTPWLY